MIRNFLKMQGGTWAENERIQAASKATNGSNGAATDKQSSILEKIYAHRKISVEAQKQIPSQRPSDLQAAYDLNL